MKEYTYDDFTADEKKKFDDIMSELDRISKQNWFKRTFLLSSERFSLHSRMEGLFFSAWCRIQSKK